MTEQTAMVVFTPSGKRGHFALGTPVLTAARQLGVDLDSVCGGRGICSKCQIQPAYGDFPKHGLQVTETALSPWNKVEERYKSKRGMIDGRRLGCQAQIQGNIVIDVPEESQVHQQVIRKAAEQRDIALNPAVQCFAITVTEPDMHIPMGDLERLIEALQTQHQQNTSIRCALPVLQKLQTTLRVAKWKVNVALYTPLHGEQSEILDIWPQNDPKPIYGCAFDIGSTTIACHLTDLQTGEVVASAGKMNPQIRFGEDLMSRVSYAMLHKEGAGEMTKAIQEAIQALLEEATAQIGQTTESILECVFVGNPIMHHLLLGIDPTELGGAPFALATGDGITLPASALNLKMHPSGQVYILPCIAGHVGADAAAVALSEEIYHEDKLTLIVDVGTNAEILLGNQERVLACSSPTGPAFEGAQISSGQRAAPGAIERVRIDPVTKVARFKVIGCDLWSDAPDFAKQTEKTGITGIAGSGIIEAIAEMRIAGILDENGVIVGAEELPPHLVAEGRTYSYILYASDPQNNAMRPILITQNDVRAIQLAKAALYAGARLLMDDLNVNHIEKIVLAGAFGAHISPLHAMALGMIPNCDIDQVHSAGNAASTGARIALLNREKRAEIEKQVHKIHKIETAIEPRFQEHFVEAIAIPHKTAKFSELNALVNFPDIKQPETGSNSTVKKRRRKRPS